MRGMLDSHALSNARRFRPGRVHVAMVVFAIGFSVLIFVISHFYLLPAMQAASNATPKEKASLRAYATLLLAVVLFIILVGLLLVFRSGRWFNKVSRPEKRVKTQYVDAWAEAGKRAKVPDTLDEEIQ